MEIMPYALTLLGYLVIACWIIIRGPGWIVKLVRFLKHKFCAPGSRPFVGR